MTDIELSDPVFVVAVDHARTAGLSLREWITRAIAQKAVEQDNAAPDGEFLFDDGGFASPVIPGLVDVL